MDAVTTPLPTDHNLMTRVLAGLGPQCDVPCAWFCGMARTMIWAANLR